MNIQIQILSVTTETKPTAKSSYQVLEVAYKDLNNGGKVSSKKIMSFTNKTVFENMSLARPADVFDVEMVKNDKGYWDWTTTTKASNVNGTPRSTGPTASATSVSSPAKGGWETPEERAKKQVYIIRQSSLSTAVQALTVGRKGEIKTEEIIELAKRFEDFVFGTTSAPVVVGTIEDMEEDPLPY